MSDVLERYERPASRRDPRETLEPLLDDLLRGLDFEKAVVLLYDDEQVALRGSFGLGVADAAAQSLVCPLSQADDPIVAALRGGVPTLVADLAREGISPVVTPPDGSAPARAGWVMRPRASA